MDACHDQRVLRSNTSHEIGLDCSYNVINNLDLEPKCNNQSLELNDSVSDYDESPIDSESESPYLRGVQGIGRQPNNLQCLRAQDAIPRGKRRKPLPVPPRWYAEYIQHFQFDPIEWKSPKYKQYREKQATPKEREKGKKGPWNDEIEYAFQKGWSTTLTASGETQLTIRSQLYASMVGEAGLRTILEVSFVEAMNGSLGASGSKHELLWTESRSQVIFKS